MNTRQCYRSRLRATTRLATLGILALVGALILGGCTKPGTLGRALGFNALPGWQTDDHSAAWPALLKSCTAVKRIESEHFGAVCERAKKLSKPDAVAARRFFEENFVPRAVRSPDGNTGLITGYYAPWLNGSRTRSETFQWPLYARPDDMLHIDLGDLFPELKGKRVRGRVEGKRVVPYFSRDAIDSEPENSPLQGNELLWVDDAADAFFLHIQGSGRVRFEDGSVVGVGYADQNGHPYRSIGRELIDREQIKREDVSLQSIRAWLDANPEKEMELFATNPSYVFFTLNENGALEPKGSLAVRLTPERSIAVDRTRIPFGLPMWIDTTLPDSEIPWRRVVMAQDTGGAIRGEVRADVFFGSSDRAETLAGGMKQRGRLWLLEPRAKPVRQ